MKILFLVSANLILISTLLFSQTEQLMHSLTQGISQGGDSVAGKIKDFFYIKNIQIQGNSRIRTQDLMKTLPLEKSTAWWMFNRDKIEKMLLSNSLIDGAELSPCGYSDWGCFNLKIVERKPQYVALIGNNPWLLGSDGGFIAPLSGDRIPLSAAELAETVMIKGLLEKNLSPDVLEVKINFLSQAIAAIEKKLKQKIKQIEVNSDSEITLLFNNFSFPVRLTFEEASLARIEDQAVRLKKIISEYSGRLNEVKEIDLAFDNIAVVKKAEIKIPEQKK